MTDDWRPSWWHTREHELEDEIQRRRAENERLREVLRRIEDGYYEAAPPWAMAEAYPIKRLRRKQMMELARAALGEER